MIDIYYSRVGCNSYIVFDENDDAFLIDPGYSMNNALVEHVKKLNKNIKAILITHGHYDHIYALKEICDLYPNAEVYISDKEKEFLTNPELNLTSYPEFGELQIINYFPKNLIEVNCKTEIKIGNFNIKVIETPYHTIGSICYYLEKDKILFTGDTLFYSTIGRSDLPTGDTSLIESTLKKLIALPDDLKVYPGHGPITTLNREKLHNAYLKNI